METKVLNQAVKRNTERFPEDFCWKILKDEFETLRSQIVTSNNNNYEDLELRGGRRYFPYVFTEQGVAMLSSVLKSKAAIKVNIQIMRAFIKMRNLVRENLVLLSKIEKVEEKQIKDKIEVDKKFEKVFKSLEVKKPEFGIYYNNQLFDAYKFIADLVKSTKERLILIDNFINENTFYFLKNVDKKVNVLIYTKNLTKELDLIKDKFNSQFKTDIQLREFKLSHDRFLIIDNNLYHLWVLH